MKNKGKMIIIIVLMIILIIVTVILTNKLISLMTSKEPDDIMAKIDNTIENHLQNTTNENNTANIIEENVIENNTVNENNDLVNQNVINSNTSTDKEQEVDKETIEQEVNSKEKAINIAKNDWGENSTVYFSYEGVDNGKHIVYVRDNATTRVLRIYTIDVNSGEFAVQ